MDVCGSNRTIFILLPYDMTGDWNFIVFLPLSLFNLECITHIILQMLREPKTRENLCREKNYYLVFYSSPNKEIFFFNFHSNIFCENDGKLQRNELKMDVELSFRLLFVVLSVEVIVPFLEEGAFQPSLESFPLKP